MWPSLFILFIILKYVELIKDFNIKHAQATAFKKYWLDENWMYENKIVIEREIIVNS